MKTSISKIEEGELTLRSKKLTELIKTLSFTDTVFYLLSGKLANEKESKIFSAMLVAIIDHGMGTASVQSARYVVSAGNTINASLAAGILAIGDRHGGAIEKAMEQFSAAAKSGNKSEDIMKFVQEKLANKELLYGYGHKVYSEDPRATAILELCKEIEFTSKYIDTALAIEKTLEVTKGKKLPLNIDGLIAALLLEMGFPATVGKGFFCIGRLPGLLAHVLEQNKEGKLLRVKEEDIEFLKVENE